MQLRICTLQSEGMQAENRECSAGMLSCRPQKMDPSKFSKSFGFFFGLINQDDVNRRDLGA
jgi:hypothetical protein